MPKRCPFNIHDAARYGETDKIIEYIDYLEAKEDRLTGMEEVLNGIEASKLPGKDAFLKQFSNFKTG